MSAERLTLKKELLEMRARAVVAWDDMICAKASFMKAAQKTITELEE